VLRASLDAMATSGRQLMTSVSETAALPRAMLLRAELAAARGDRADAQTWARAVVQLWKNSDNTLTASRERARLLAQ
jgi:hypothetical protein